MTATSPADIANLIGLLKAAFPNYRPEPETATVFLRLLADLPRELLEMAAIACVSEPGRAFAPSVGEIRGKAGELRARAGGLPSALEAFKEVMDMPTHQDRYNAHWKDESGAWVMEVRQRRFSHPLVEKVADDLGWPSLFPSQNLNTDRATFNRAYEAVLEQAMREASELPAVREFVDSQANLLTAGDGTPYEVVLRTSWKPERDDEADPDR